MFDIVMYRGVNTALITTITWVILRIVMGEVVCVTEATHIIGQHNPLVFAVFNPWLVTSKTIMSERRCRSVRFGFILHMQYFHEMFLLSVDQSTLRPP